MFKIKINYCANYFNVLSLYMSDYADLHVVPCFLLFYDFLKMWHSKAWVEGGFLQRDPVVTFCWAPGYTANTKLL